ncbi:hypothetical protein TGVAND_439050, partial [Toxoplasma gondii VAND]
VIGCVSLCSLSARLLGVLFRRRRCSPRCRITLARLVDVLGVAAPHGPAVVWFTTRRVHARVDERLPVVSRYALCLRHARAFCSGAGGKRAKGRG